MVQLNMSVTHLDFDWRVIRVEVDIQQDTLWP